MHISSLNNFTTEDTEDTEFYFIRRHGLPQSIIYIVETVRVFDLLFPCVLRVLCGEFYFCRI